MNTAQWPRYTDGTLVHEGDSIRFHQAAGGILAPSDWMYGTAVPSTRFGLPSLVLENGDRHYNLFSHVIERAS